MPVQLQPFPNARGTQGYGEGTTLAFATRGFWSTYGLVRPQVFDVIEFNLQLTRDVSRALQTTEEVARPLQITKIVKRDLEG